LTIWAARWGARHRLWPPPASTRSERASIEDRRDLADDATVEQALGAGQHVVQLQLRLRGKQRERLGVEREARLQQVHQPLVGLVERDRGAVHA